MSTTPRPEQPDGSPAEVLHPAYEQVRSVLHAGLEQPEAAPAEVRDAALAAAMAEAVALNPAVPSLTARRSIRLEGSQRWMAAAAGLVVLFGLGTVARNLGDTSGSAGSASRALDASVVSTPTADASEPASMGTAAPGSANSGTAAPGASTKGLGTIPPGNTFLNTTVAGSPGVTSAAVGLLAVRSVADLATLPDQYAPVVANTVAGEVSTRPSTGCVLTVGEVVVAEVSFNGTPAWVVRNATAGSARLLGLDCSELARTP